jgi:uncharacterized protein YbjT (DUF2867 family)
MSHPLSRVLVVGATGGIGRRVVAAAQRHDLPITALVRDLKRGESLLPRVELVQGDLEQPGSLAAAVRGIDAVLFTHGGPGSPDTARRIDYGGVANVLHALDGRTPRIARMTSIGVCRRENPDSSVGQLLDWKRRSERLIRASGAPYTIVRPGWFDHVGPGDDRLVFEQGDIGNGGIGRDQLAGVLVRSLLTDTATSRTFELFAAPGASPTDWEDLFAALKPDTEGALDGAADPVTLPSLDDEPQVVRENIAHLAAHGACG